MGSSQQGAQNQVVCTALSTFPPPLLIFFALQTHTGGEDAFFISQAGHGAVAVSDGVSAWAQSSCLSLLS
jgi:hypothetical protein